VLQKVRPSATKGVRKGWENKKFVIQREKNICKNFEEVGEGRTTMAIRTRGGKKKLLIIKNQTGRSAEGKTFYPSAARGRVNRLVPRVVRRTT